MSDRDLHMCISTLFADPYAPDEAVISAALAACQAEGMAAISWWSLYQFILNGAEVSDDEINALIADHGLRVSIVEGIAGWANAPTVDKALADARFTLDVCAKVGAAKVVIVTLDAELADRDQTVTNLGAIADLGAEYGVDLCLEYLPWTAIPDIGTGWSLIEEAGRDNVGLMLDSWHWYHQPGGPGAANTEKLLSLPPDAIRVLQLCDAHDTMGDDPLIECQTNRPMPGDGVVDNHALLGLLDEMGADPIIALEVFNTANAALGPAAAAANIVGAARAVLASQPS